MHTQRTIMLIVLAVFVAGVAAGVAVIWWLGPGLGAIVILGAAVVVAAVYVRAIRPWYLRWGATDEEVTMAMPGDDLVPNTDPATRAIGIAAQPEDVWPWLVQLGFGKAGWYSYDWIDNDGHPSAEEVIPEYQTLRVGDQILTMPEMGFTVTAVDPDRSHRQHAGRWVDQLVPRPLSPRWRCHPVGEPLAAEASRRPILQPPSSPPLPARARSSWSRRCCEGSSPGSCGAHRRAAAQRIGRSTIDRRRPFGPTASSATETAR